MTEIHSANSTQKWGNSEFIRILKSPLAVDSKPFLAYVAAYKPPYKALEAICGQTRSFDIAVRYHSEPQPDDPLLTLADYVLTGGLSKFHSANQLLTSLDLTKRYHGFLFLMATSNLSLAMLIDCFCMRPK